MFNRFECVTFYLINLKYTDLIYKVTAAVKLNGLKYTFLFLSQLVTEKQHRLAILTTVVSEYSTVTFHH